MGVIEKIRVRLVLLILVPYSPCHVMTLKSSARSTSWRCSLRCYQFKTIVGVNN